MAIDKNKFGSSPEAGDSYTGRHTKTMKQILDMAKAVEGDSKKAEIVLEYQKTFNEATKLNQKVNTEQSKQLVATLEQIAEKLVGEKDISDAKLKNREIELRSVMSNINTISKTLTINSETQNKKLISPIENLTRSLEMQVEQLDTVSQSRELKGQIKSLEGTFGLKSDESTKLIKETYVQVSSNLEKAIKENDQIGIELAKEQLGILSQSVQTEEKRREAAKADADAKNLFVMMTNKLTSLDEKFKNIAGGIASKGSFLAKLIPLGLLILSQVDREKFLGVMEWIKNAFLGLLDLFKTIYKILEEGLPQIFRGIEDILNGDITKGLSALWDNFGLIASLIGLIALKVFGITGVLTGVVKVVQFATFVFKFFSGLIVTKLIPSLMAMLSGLAIKLAPILVVAAPFIAIAAAIGLALWGLYELLDYVGKELGFSGIGDLLLVGVAYLKDGFGHVANFLIDTINGAINAVSGIASTVAGWLGFDLDLPKGEFKRLATDNAEKLSAELRDKEAKRKAEAQIETSKGGTGDVPDFWDGKGLAPSGLPIIPSSGGAGFDLNNLSLENNAAMQELMMGGGKSSIVSAPVVNAANNSTAVTNVVQQPATRTSMYMGSFSYAR